MAPLGWIAFGVTVLTLLTAWLWPLLGATTARAAHRVTYINVEQRIAAAQRAALEQEHDEAILLGPVSAWVAEGEAQAVRDWHQKHPPAPVPSASKWVTVWHPCNGMDHQIPNHPVAIADFLARGWILRG